MIAAAALSLALRQADLDKALDFVSLPARIENLLPKLTKQTGVPLAFADETRDDVLVVRVKDATLQQLMDKIAQADSAKWIPVERGYKLVRPKELDKEEADEELAEQSASWSEALKEQRDLVKQTPLLTKETAVKLLADVEAHNRLSPGDGVIEKEMRNRAMFKLLDRMPLNRLPQRLEATITPDLIPDYRETTRVFSNQPTAMEEKLTPAMSRVIEESFQAQNLFAQAVKNHYPKGMPDLQHRSDVDVTPYAAELKAPRILVLISGLCQVRVRITDENHLVLNTAANPLYQNEPTRPPTRVADDPRIIAFDPLTVEFATDVRRHACGGASAELKRVLERPEDYDPLALTSSSGFVRYGELKDLNVVARLTDFCDFRFRLLNMRRPSNNIETTVKIWEEFYRGMLSWSGSPGWIVAKPFRPHYTRTHQLDRRSMGVLFRIAANRSASMEDVANCYAMQPKGADPSEILWAYAPLLQGHDCNLEPAAPDILRFYGCLSFLQKRAIWDGTGVTAGSLSPSQRQSLDDLVFSDKRGLTVPDAARNGDVGYEGFPPEGLPDGIPAETRISAFARQTPSVLARTTALGFPQVGQYDIPALAQMAHAKNKQDPISGLSQYEGFLPVGHATGSILITFWPDRTLTLPVDFSIITSNTFTPFADLPDATRYDFDTEIARLGGDHRPVWSAPARRRFPLRDLSR